MKNKKIGIIAIIIATLLFVSGCSLSGNEETSEYKHKKQSYSTVNEENILYSETFGDTTLIFESIGEYDEMNQNVVVKKSMDGGKNYVDVTTSPVPVSKNLSETRKPQFIFFDEYTGLIMYNSWIFNTSFTYIYVTQDGGKTFEKANVDWGDTHYDICEIKEAPYKEKYKLIMPCLTSKQTGVDEHGRIKGFEDVTITFESNDYGLNWKLVEEK